MNIQQQLLTYKTEESYKKFSEKIINSNYPLLGLRTDIIKKIAKENVDKYQDYFLEEHYYYEEYMIHGMMIGYLKKDFDLIIQLIDDYIKLINSWALCDSVVSNLKIINKNYKNYYNKIIEYANSESEFTSRFGYCVLLCYYINKERKEYLNDILSLCNKEHEKYYVQMMVAWLLSVVYIKFKDEALRFLNNCKLDDFTFNKTISKICDSYRVSKQEKDELKKIRR